MQVGIIGLPTSGKTTLFNILTGAHAETHRYGAEKKEANVGVAKVPDARLDFLSSLYNPKKTTPATIELVDVAGLVPGEARSGGFAPSLIAALRTVDALIHVVRAFSDDEILHPAGSVDPQRDIDELALELTFADLAVIEKRLEKLPLEVQRKKGSEQIEAQRELDLMQKCRDALDKGVALRDLEFSEDEKRAMRGYTFLSLKPLLVVLNIGEEQIAAPPEVDVPALALSVKVESDIAEMPADERAEFLEAMGLEEPARDRLIRFAYESLGLQSFFTVGEDEVRAWTIKRGDTAVVAASKIHSDIARGFIRAETVAFDKLKELGSWNAAREKGALRLEGKEYVMHDGDCVNFRFSV
jgi:GTP-binding protein YchF